MKKVLALVVCVAMVACFAITALGADSYITVNNAQAAAGEEVTLTYAFAEGSGVGAWNAQLEYDSTKLELVEAAGPEGGMFAGGFMEVNVAASEDNADVDTVYFGYMSTGGMTSGGNFATVTFKVLEGLAADASTEVTLVTTTVSDSDFGALNADEFTAVATVTNQAQEPSSEEPSSEEPSSEEPSSQEPSSQDPSSVESTTSTDSTTSTPVSTTTSTGGSNSTTASGNPPTGDAGIAVVAAVLCAAAGAAFVVSKKQK